jgi:acyl-coenzyme A synthetase/AMP-(fatty) acid ligase/thioesterase domain-containing protein
VLIASPEFEAEIQAATALGLTVLIAHDGSSPLDWEIRQPAARIRVRARNLEAVLLLITSATTGSSKLVPIAAGSLDVRVASRRDSLRLSSSDRMLLLTSLCHIIGIENTFAQFLAGGTVVATGGFDSADYVRWLGDLRPTWYDCAPTVHQAALVQLKLEAPSSPFSLRFIQSAGAPLPSKVKHELEQILHVPVFNDYGMTEACPIATDAFLEGYHDPSSAGRSCGLDISIMSPSGELLPPDEEGEIAVRGKWVFSGYADNPEANLIAFKDGWFRTGDAGRLDKEGNLFVTGRLKEMINRGGEKILPSEVDVAIASHPAVLDAATFAIPHPTLGEDVACAVVLRTSPSTEAPVSAVELRRFAAQRLAKFKVPRRIYFVDQIPRSELGKPQRWLLTETIVSKSTALPLPADVKERKSDDAKDVLYELHAIWSRILDRYDLGFDDDFFCAGGDSLAAINMLVEVDQHFGSLTSALAASFLDEPTLIHLTNLVNTTLLVTPGQSTSSEIQIFSVRKGGSGRRLFCVPADEDEGLYFRRLAMRLCDDMDLSIVRPANNVHSQRLFTIERAGAVMAALIRKEQPEGPYFVGGFCYGGVVAVEAARQLIIGGQDVRVILFDVPMPGYPSLFSGWPVLIKEVRDKSHKAGNCPEVASIHRDRAFSLGRVAGITRAIARRLTWSATVAVRHIMVAFEHLPAIRLFLHWLQFDYFPFYRARPIDAPIIHFLCTDEPHIIENVSRFGWRSMARRGIDERFLDFDHRNIFHESNLPKIVEALRQWNSTTNPLADEGKLTLHRTDSGDAN